MSVHLLSRPDVSVYHADWRELAALGQRCDLLCVDAPYSERTTVQHGNGAQTANRAAHWVESEKVKAKVPPQPGDPKRWRLKYEATRKSERRKLNYSAWTPEDVFSFVLTWAPLTGGWIVSLTDHVLAPAWSEALTATGRYVFSPLACVEPGSRVRMVGDGPAQWSVLAIVARPKNAKFAKWGALPGAYVVPPGHNGRAQSGGKLLVGGKPLWLMERIVEDYSRPGDLVCDPCCGGGTTLIAALRTGRRALGGDLDEAHAQMAAKACGGMVQVPLFAGGVR